MNMQNVTDATDKTKKDSGRTLVGKIARLPDAIREQLNRRMRDGEPAATMLAWLNELPEVKSILAEQFGGAPIKHQNLSKWRRGGYERWLQAQEPYKGIVALSQDAGVFSRAGAGKLAQGVAALAAAWLLEFIRKVSPDKCTTKDIAQIAFASACLLKGDQTNEQLKLAEKRVLQRDEQLLMTRDRDYRNAMAIGLRLLGDERAKAIEASSHSYAEKIELLGLHTFGEELWQARYVPPGVDDLANQPSKQ